MIVLFDNLGKCEKKGTLTGSSGVIMCVEFENNVSIIITRVKERIIHVVGLHITLVCSSCIGVLIL